MISHYANDSASADWLIESATLEHVASGVCIEYRNGWISVDGVVKVDSLQNATELLAEVA